MGKEDSVLDDNPPHNAYELGERIEKDPHKLATGDAEVHSLAQTATKTLFDHGVKYESESLPYISSLLESVAPHNSGSISKKTHPLFPATQLNELVLDGMDNDQVWQQLELRSGKLGRVLDTVMSSGVEMDSEDEEGPCDTDSMSTNDADDDEEDDDGWEDASEDAEEGFAGASDLSDVDPDEHIYEPLHSEEEQQHVKQVKEREELMHMYGVRGPVPGDKDLFDLLDDEQDSSRRRKPKHPSLDDDFFSIDEFNRMTEQDEHGGNAAEPGLDLFTPVDVEEEEEDEEEHFGGPDIHYSDFFEPPKEAKGRSGKSRPAVARPEVPVRKHSVRFNEQVRVRPIKKCSQRQAASLLMSPPDGEWERDASHEDEIEVEDAVSGMPEENSEVWEEEEEEETEEEEEGEEEEEEEEEVEEDKDVDGDDGMDVDEPDTFESEEEKEAHMLQRVSNDLFDDGQDAERDDRSTHERRLAALNEEIAQYEQENVQKKDWALMGEASRRERPVNSLLEEDLDFEHTAKVKPIATEERIDSIEDMIKQRILAKQYDDVLRQQDMDALPFAPSKLLELSDAKNAKSLAELYEDEYRIAHGETDAPLAEADAKLANEHRQIGNDLDKLLNSLDALSNAHYTPKAPKAAITTISNTPSIAMESALPSTMSTGTMLAPEEVYAASTHAPAMTGAKSEMVPREKRKMHNQLRQVKRKRNDRIRRAEEEIARSRGAPLKQGTKTEKDKALKSLMGNKGVSVVGKDSKRNAFQDGKAKQSIPAGSQWKL